MMPEGVFLKAITQLGIIFAVLSIGSPASLALYNREGEIKPNKVERELQNYRMKGGEQAKAFYFNRGL